jgi:ABC-type nitrate/sulfonate/bicarbonate transport system substrate-binding protein
MSLKKALILLMISFLLVSCRLQSQSPDTQKAESTSVKDSQELISVKAGHLIALDMAPLFIGVESGCFKKNGLAVETVFFKNPGDNNAALAGGEIDFSTNPFTLPFFAANSGVPIKTVSAAGGWGIMEVIADGKYNLRSMKDLANYASQNPNKKLSIATLRGDTLELILLDAFEKHGLSTEDFEMIYFDDLLAMVDAFRLGEVDILSHIKPYTTKLVADAGATVITSNAKVWSPTAPNTVVSVLKNSLQKRPKVVEAYLKSLQCAAKIINKNPENAVSILQKGNYFKVNSSILLRAFKSQPIPVSFTPDLEAIENVINKMVKLNYIREDIPTEKIFNLKIIRSLESESP